jgi:hypothetical protein
MKKVEMFNGIVADSNVDGRFTISGEIVTVKPVDKATHPDQTGDSHVITIQNLAGNHQVWLGDNMIASFGLANVVFAGNVISMVADQRKAGETTYTDRATGKTELHKKDGWGAVSVDNAGKVLLNLLGYDKADKKALAKLRETNVPTFTAQAPKVVFSTTSVDMNSADSIKSKLADYRAQRENAPAHLVAGFDSRILQLEQQLMVLAPKTETPAQKKKREEAEAAAKLAESNT